MNIPVVLENNFSSASNLLDIMNILIVLGDHFGISTNEVQQVFQINHSEIEEYLFWLSTPRRKGTRDSGRMQDTITSCIWRKPEGSRETEENSR
ncbi:hypothetical protein JTB14_011503 [Gonioctena quinquepunctata]|nr:hypothetical protein JTB14_011503 [Gonioctena quinquepunctata]